VEPLSSNETVEPIPWWHNGNSNCDTDFLFITSRTGLIYIEPRFGCAVSRYECPGVEDEKSEVSLGVDFSKKDEFDEVPL
jgi:hypothetical protein